MPSDRIPSDRAALNRTPSAARSPTTVRGDAAEHAAARLLTAAGLIPVAAKVRYKVGELDLIMRDGDTLVFVEVRARRSMAFGGAAASIDARKQLRLRRAAERYLQLTRGGRAWPPCRFDVVAFEGDRVNWIRDAFGA